MPKTKKFDPDQPRDESGRFGSGGGMGVGGNDSGSLGSSGSGASIESRGTSLKVSDESVSGTVVIETRDDFDTDSVSDSDVADYVSSDDAIGSYGGNAGSALAGNIAGTKVTGVKRGKGYITAKVTFELETPVSEMESGDSYGTFGLTRGTLGLEGKQRRLTMPTPKADESRDDYVSRCIPILINEGTTDDSKQAAAICHSMWEKHTAEKEGRNARPAELAVVALTLAAKGCKQGNGWLVRRKQMEKLCPSCGDAMGKMGIDRLDLLRLKQMPEPLKQGLCDKFGPDPGLFTECVGSSLGDFDPGDQDAFCAWLHHECTGEWPGEHKESHQAIGGVTVNLPPIELSPSGETRLLDRLTTSPNHLF